MWMLCYLLDIIRLLAIDARIRHAHFPAQSRATMRPKVDSGQATTHQSSLLNRVLVCSVSLMSRSWTSLSACREQGWILLAIFAASCVPSSWSP
jgi:hypothetical protein